MSYKMKASGFELEITIEELDKLELHEEIIDTYLQELADAIEDTNLVMDPVIVDKNSGVILDGMHRATALEKLGFDKIPVCKVDYKDSRVELGSWCRFFKDVGIEEVLDICNRYDFEVGSCDHDNIDDILSDRSSDLLLITQEECYTLDRNSNNISEIFDAAIEIEEELRDRGYKPHYETENNIMEKLELEEIAVLVPPATKDEVIQIATEGSVFSHKTTRHVIPARPMRINVPLPLLKKDVETADAEMTKKLEKRDIRDLSPGSRFEGREYEEELVIFE